MAKPKNDKSKLNPKQRKKQRRKLRQDERDYTRLYLKFGPNAARAEATLKPKQWERSKHIAKRLGITLDSFHDPSVPRPLKERTKAGLRHQAMRTMRKAYKPVLTGLNQQSERIKALDEKRRTDNLHYQQWVADQLAALDKSKAAVDSTVQSHLDTVRADRSEALGQEQQDALAGAGNYQNENVTSQRSDSTALDFSDETAQELTQLDNTRQTMDETLLRSTDRSAAASANTIALGAAREADRVSQTWEALMDVADEKEKVKLQRAADSAKEVSRLLDQEISKSQSNREFKAALAKLNLDKKGLQQDAHQFAQTLAQNRLENLQDYKLGKARINESKRATNLLDAYRNEQISLGRDRLDLDWWKAKHPTKSAGGGGSKTLTEKKRQKNQMNFSEAYAQVSTADLPIKHNGKVKTLPMTGTRAKNNRNWVINALVAEGYGRATANAVWKAYVANNGNDYGNWKVYYGSYVDHSSP